MLLGYQAHFLCIVRAFLTLCALSSNEANSPPEENTDNRIVGLCWSFLFSTGFLQRGKTEDLGRVPCILSSKTPSMPHSEKCPLCDCEAEFAEGIISTSPWVLCCDLTTGSFLEFMPGLKLQGKSFSGVVVERWMNKKALT